MKPLSEKKYANGDFDYADVKEAVNRLLKKLRIRARKGWEGYIDLIHRDDIEQFLKEEFGELVE